MSTRLDPTRPAQADDSQPAGGLQVRAREIFLFLICFFVLQTSGHVFSPDGVVVGRVTESIAHGRGAQVDPKWIPAGYLYQGTGGARYAKYPPGLSLIALPFYGVGAALDEIAPSESVDAFTGHRILWYPALDPHDDWRFFGMALTNSVVVAAICALLFLFVVHLGYGRRAALLVALTAAFATPLWHYAKTFFSEPLGGLAVLAFALLAETGLRSGSMRRCFLAGLALGFTVMARYAHVLLLPLAAAALLPYALRVVEERKRRVQFLGAIAAGAALVLLVLMAFNQARFGTPLATGYERELVRSFRTMGTGLRGLLIGPGRGMLVYFPAILVALLTFRKAMKRQARWTLFTWGGFLVLLLFYAQWHEWEGGWCWGPRFLVPTIPFLCLQLAPFFEDPPARRWLRWGGYGLIGLSLVIALSGTLVSYTDYHHALREQYGREHYYDVSLWDWAAFPPITYWGFSPWSFFFPRALATPSVWWLAGLFGALAVYTAYRGRVLVGRWVGQDRGAATLMERGAEGDREAPVLTVPPESRGDAKRAWFLRERTLWAAGGLLAAVVCALVSIHSGPHVALHFDFEQQRYGKGWESTGDAFGSGPPQAFRRDQPEIQGWFGSRLVNTSSPEDGDRTGTLRSPVFRIDGARATFKIGGGRDAERLYARLLVEGDEAFRATGTDGLRLAEVEWDLSRYRGRRARLELVDEAAGEGGYLLFDDLRIYR